MLLFLFLFSVCYSFENARIHFRHLFVFDSKISILYYFMGWTYAQSQKAPSPTYILNLKLLL